MLALSRITDLQCGHTRVLPGSDNPRAALTVVHSPKVCQSPALSMECTPINRSAYASSLFNPTELHASAHSRSGGDGQRPRFQIAVENAGLEEFDAGCRFDIP